MLPWFLTTLAPPLTGGQTLKPLSVRTETVVARQSVAFETLEVRRTSGISAQVGDVVTVHYRVLSGDRVLADSELLGVNYSVTLGAGDAPFAIELGMKGLQVKGYRRFKVDARDLGEGFADRWPEVAGAVVIELTVIEIARPATPSE
jgi:FKBP-type peptidyl-prolyl cis-trans isomerase (trigger factor)